MANHLPGGEGGEAGEAQQVRNGIDGLVELDVAVVDGVQQLTMTEAPSAMNDTLGSSNVYTGSGTKAGTSSNYAVVRTKRPGPRSGRFSLRHRISSPAADRHADKH